MRHLNNIVQEHDQLQELEGKILEHSDGRDSSGSNTKRLGRCYIACKRGVCAVLVDC
jgi:hypothetical protein